MTMPIQFVDGHHQVTDRDGNVEIDDVDSDKESFCEEVDEIGADGKVHHIKKWHHHTMDHFQVRKEFFSSILFRGCLENVSTHAQILVHTIFILYYCYLFVITILLFIIIIIALHFTRVSLYDVMYIPSCMLMYCRSTVENGASLPLQALPLA